MIRPVLSFLSLLSLLCLSLMSWGQINVNWTVHPVFAAPAQQVVDAGKTVYFTSGGSLFSYDKERNESMSHTTANGLNGVDVTGIFYNKEKKSLLIAYSTGNIDLMDADGSIVNLSDITESSVAPPLTITDAAFSGDRLFVSTAFGVVEYSLKRMEVTQSGIYGTPVTAIAVMGSNLIMACEGKILTTEIDGNLRSLHSFKELATLPDVTGIYPISDSEALITMLQGSSTRIVKLEVDLTNSTLTYSGEITTRPGNFRLTADSDGDFHFLSGCTLYGISADGTRETFTAVLPDEFEGCKIGTTNLSDGLWTLNRDGLACHIIEDRKLTCLSDRHRPEQFPVKEVSYMFPTADGLGILAMNHGSTAYRFDRPGSAGFSKPLNLARINLEDGTTADLTPFPIEAHLPLAQERQAAAGKYVLGPTAVVQDPDDADLYYISTSTDGIYLITADGTLIGQYNEGNSPLKRIDERNIAYHVTIDRGGNLWMSTHSEGDDEGPVFILPSDKRKLNTSQIKATDWQPLMRADKSFPGTHDVQILHCTHSPLIFRIDAYDHFLAYDTRGTSADLTDDDYTVHRHPLDQDGLLFSPERYSAICEDRNGAVWIGTDMGLIEIARPSEALNENLRVRRLKVPRADGSGMADYLLGNELIYDIAVDAANRKWIATEKSGLFVVTANGDGILANFTTANSPLPTNTIYSVYADPLSEQIYVGTPEGLFSCSSGATPVAEDYSAVKIYPNPVRPDYSGPINIEGLMEGSMVKIVSATGTVIYQGRAEGGKMSWEGYTHAGVRPPSGVYYVLISTSGNGQNESAAGKFMIIR